MIILLQNVNKNLKKKKIGAFLRIHRTQGKILDLL